LFSKKNKLDAKTHPEIGRVNSPLKRVFSQRFGFQLVIKKLEADAVLSNCDIFIMF